MNEKELYKQKYRAQLDVWKADIVKLKAKALGTKADVQIEMDKHVKELDHRIQEASTKLSELAGASEDAWGSVKKGVASAWDSLKSAVSDATSRFKD
ncbi:MAG: coiled coil domain-containing protein [Ignavibacteria bacterium]|nr:coiled coil domain-containing protein [Ignavibacteria bacterium]